MSDSYVLDFVSGIKQAESQKEINAYIKQLSDQLSTIKLTAKIDSKALKREVDSALNGIRFKDIDALNLDESKAKLKVRKLLRMPGHMQRKRL